MSKILACSSLARSSSLVEKSAQPTKLSLCPVLTNSGWSYQRRADFLIGFQYIFAYVDTLEFTS
jgi:hypothetical protein